MTSSTKYRNKKHKLLSIFASLNAEEQKSFKKHIDQSHAERSDIVKFMAVLYAHRKRLQQEKLSTEISTKHFPHLSPKNLANLMSKIKSSLEDWMICYDLKLSKYDKELALIKSYNNRGIYGEANNIATKLEKKIEDEPKFDLRKTRALYLLKDYQYFSDNPIKYVEGVPMLEAVVTNFNIYYKELIHVYNAELCNWGRIKNYDFSNIRQANTERVASIPETTQTKIVKNVELLMRDFDLEYLYVICDKLFGEKLVEMSFLHSMFCEYAIFCCAQNIRKNVITDFGLLARLYHHGLESKVLLKEGKLSLIRFHNIISSISQVDTLDHVDEFIEKWIHVVSTKSPATAKIIAKVQNCFHHGNYDDIILHLRSVKFESKMQKLRALKFELIALYETEELDLFYSALHNFNRMNLRSKGVISKRFFETNRNTVKLLNYLVKGDWNSLSYILHSGDPIYFRNYLIRKLKKR